MASAKVKTIQRLRSDTINIEDYGDFISPNGSMTKLDDVIDKLDEQKGAESI